MQACNAPPPAAKVCTHSPAAPPPCARQHGNILDDWMALVQEWCADQGYSANYCASVNFTKGCEPRDPFSPCGTALVSATCEELADCVHTNIDHTAVTRSVSLAVGKKGLLVKKGQRGRWHGRWARGSAAAGPPSLAWRGC